MDVDANRRVSVSLSQVCSNACAFCAIASASRSGERGATTAAAPAVEPSVTLEQASERGANEVTFVGGEPTMDARLTDLVAQARRLGFVRVGIQTHARDLAVGGLAATLARAGLTDVHVSLHAAEPLAHDYHTGMPGSFVGALAGIGAARAAGLAVVASTVLTRSNHKVIGAVPGLLAMRGVSAWCVWVPRVAGRLAEHPDRLVPRLALALPYALHALEVAQKRGLPAWIAGAPLCLLGPFAARAMDDAPRAYGGACSQCPSRDRCSGVDSWYLARFGGDELASRDAPHATDDHAALRRQFVGAGVIVNAGDVRPKPLRTTLPVVRGNDSR